jgi:hypothetical protein
MRIAHQGRVCIFHTIAHLKKVWGSDYNVYICMYVFLGQRSCVIVGLVSKTKIGECTHPCNVYQTRFNIKITFLHWDEKRGGLTPPKKGKGGDYFNNILEKCNLMDILFIVSSQRMGKSHKVVKFIFEGDKCLVEGMRYVLLALVCFGGANLLFFIH